MKASKQAPKREYRYRLFSTTRVTCGPEVAEFITKHSGGVIQIEYGGETVFVPELGSPIYRDDAKFMGSEHLHGDGFSIIMVDADLAEPIFWFDTHAVISRAGLKIGLVEGPDLPLYAYLTVLALAGWASYNSQLRPFEEVITEFGPHGWLEMIKEGRLPRDFYNLSGGTVQQALEFRRVIAAVNRVLKPLTSLAEELYIPQKFKPDTGQQPPHEVKADFGIPIESPASESADEPGDQVVSFAERFAVWIKERGLPEGVEIVSDLQDVIDHSDLKYVVKVVGGLIAGISEILTELIALIASCPRPSARRLLNTMAAAGDPVLASAAKEALASHTVVDDPPLPPDEPPPPDPPPNIETASTGNFGFDSDSEAPKDALDYSGYAKALAAAICDSATGMPFTLGICAPWGRGKTALMSFVKEEIEKINDTVKRSWTPNDLDQRRATVIDFNAWQFSRAEQVWAGFITTIMRKLEGGLYGFEERLRLAWKLNKSRDLPVVYNMIAFVASVAVLAGIIAVIAPNDWLAPLGLVGIGSLAFYRKVFKGAWKLASSPAAERIIQLSKLPDYASRLDPVHRMLGDIETITEEYRKGYLTGTVDRFVVFIDDIDRCEPEKIMETLEAIKHLLDLKRFVFVIAMDTRVVRHAIGKHYKFMCETAKDREEMGRFYLEKMIQVPFHLPALTAEKRRQLGDSIISKYLEEEPQPETATVTEEKVVEAAVTNRKAPPSLSREAVYMAEEPGAPEIIPALPAAPPEALVTEAAKPETTDAPRKPPLPGPLEDVRLRITPTEYRVIDDIMNTDGFDISPRLIKRFINVYMMARHILIMELLGKSGSGSGFIPHASFIKWLAVSVLHPFEAAALIRWLRSEQWVDPFAGNTLDPDKVFTHDGWFCFQEPKGPIQGATRARSDQRPFEDLKIRDLHQFGQILLAMQIDFNEVKDTLHITNCFNLVLE